MRPDPAAPGILAPDILAVVARYREDASWTADLGFPALVYDKGGDWPGGVALPNTGREAHTYLTHILGHYPDFPQYLLLLQGDPFPHLGEGADVAALRGKVLDLVDRGAGFGGLAWFRVRCDRLGRPHQMGDPAKKGRWPGWGKDIPVGAVFEQLFAGPAPKTFLASGMTGNLLVSRARILARPAGFYRRALELIAADPRDAKNTGHALERLWQLVFDGNKRLNRADYPG